MQGLFCKIFDLLRCATIQYMSMTSKKIFLTGERDVGKSTIIKRFTSELDFIPAGFSTLPGDSSADGSTDHIFLIPFGTPLEEFPETPPVAIRNKKQMGYQSFPEVFDDLGTKILMSSRGSRLIVMDELGFMESEAFAFQEAVLTCLDGKEPVLGVIKPRQISFLDKIRAHPEVQTIEVTVENRNQIFELLLENFKIV